VVVVVVSSAVAGLSFYSMSGALWTAVFFSL